MNTELASLLRAAKETPEDDAPRLVIADWLDEHGEPARAELLRVQCHPDHRWYHEGIALQARADALVAEHGDRWWGSAVEGVRVVAKRGFLTVHAPFYQLHEGLGVCPLRDAWEQGWVDGLCVSLWSCPIGDPWPLVAACPLLAEIRDLSLSGGSFDQHAASHLTRSPHLESLLALTVDAFQWTPTIELLLIESPNLPRLTRLNSSTNGLRIVAALREAAVTGVLRLEGINTLYTAARELLHRVSVPIDEVRIANVSLGKAEMPAILALPGLRSLHVQDIPDGSNVAKTIAKHAPPTLMRLRLTNSRLHQAACVNLARADRLTGLRLLDLAGNDAVGERGVVAFAQSSHLVGLRALDLRDTPLSADAVGELARVVTFPRMRRIVLSEVGLNPTRRASLLARYGSALTLASPGSAHPAIELPEDAP